MRGGLKMIYKDLFENTMDKDKFQYTNRIWNDTRLNSSWSVGYVSDIINRKHFRTKEEWVQFYYKSGEDRLKAVKELNLSEIDKSMLFSGNSYNSLPNEIKDLNYRYGRTRESLIYKGKLLYQAVLKDGNKLDLTEEECIYAVFFRVLGETWNGVVVRENNTMNYLNNKLIKHGQNVTISKTEGSFDYKYEVDFEIYKDSNLICGIQVKPISYQNGNTTELIKTKEINKIKNDAYENEFKRKVLYVYSKTNGEILNKEIIDEIIGIIKKYSI